MTAVARRVLCDYCHWEGGMGCNLNNWQTGSLRVLYRSKFWEILGHSKRKVYISSLLISVAGCQFSYGAAIRKFKRVNEWISTNLVSQSHGSSYSSHRWLAGRFASTMISNPMLIVYSFSWQSKKPQSNDQSKKPTKRTNKAFS